MYTDVQLLRFFIELHWCLCGKLIGHKCKGLFLDSRFCSIDLWIYFLKTVPPSLNYYSFVVCTETRKYKFFTFFFCKNILAKYYGLNSLWNSVSQNNYDSFQWYYWDNYDIRNDEFIVFLWPLAYNFVVALVIIYFLCENSFDFWKWHQILYPNLMNKMSYSAE